MPAAPACSPAPPVSLPSVDQQVTHLVDLGVHVLAGMSEVEMRVDSAQGEGAVDASVQNGPPRPLWHYFFDSTARPCSPATTPRPSISGPSRFPTVRVVIK